MCDSFAVLSEYTKDGSLFFGKSADCEVNEAHHLLYVPHRKHNPGEGVRITHIVIPQIAETYAVLLSKSFWMWGAEIGVNEHGLAIGNEAVHPLPAYDDTKDGIVTMDLLRLGLERARTCQEAVQVMGEAVKTYGQGGNCELRGNSHFDGSYMLADSKEAWILETAGHEFAARPIQGFETISNLYSIRNNWKVSSQGDEKPGLDWAEAVENAPRLEKSSARNRQACSTQVLADAGKGQVELRTTFNLMRAHGADYYPVSERPYGNICFHPGADGAGESQQTGAMVVQYSPDGIIAWVTGTSSSCISMFKPVFPGMEIPDVGPAPCELFNAETLWWKHERLYRRIAFDLGRWEPKIRADFEAIEERFIVEAASVLRSGDPAKKKAFMERCFKESDNATERWIREVEKQSFSYPATSYGEMWKRINRQAAMPEPFLG